MRNFAEGWPGGSLRSVARGYRSVKRENSLSDLRKSEASLAPFLNHPRCIEINEVEFSESETAIVVGNGPSLKANSRSDLPPGDVFVCNYAHRLPRDWAGTASALVVGDPDPVWLPDVVSAGAVMPPGATIYVSHRAPACPPPEWHGKPLQHVKAKTKLLDSYENPKGVAELEPLTSTSELYSYRHTPMLSIQLALLLGYRKIVLIGLDHDHIIEQITSSIPRVTHAYPETIREQEVMPKDTYLKLASEIRRTWGMYAALANLATVMGAVVYDATVNGQLDVFPKTVGKWNN